MDIFTPVLEEMAQLESWDEVKEWMISRGFMFKENQTPYRRMNAPLFMERHEDIVVRISFGWGREPGFRWLTNPHDFGLPEYPRIYGWVYCTEPLVDDYQLSIQAYKLPLRDGPAKATPQFMGFPTLIVEGS